MMELIFRLPAGFRSLAVGQKLCIDLLNILDRVTTIHVGNPSFPQPIGWNNQSAVYDDFLEACPVLALPDADEPALEKLLASAIFIYSSTVLSNMAICHQKPMWVRGALTKLLPRCTKAGEFDEEDCLFWIWNVTANAWKIGQATLPPEGVVLIEAQKRRFPDIVNPEEAAEISQRFAWNGKLINPEPWFFRRD
jgi:hypothetical protein